MVCEYVCKYVCINGYVNMFVHMYVNMQVVIWSNLRQTFYGINLIVQLGFQCLIILTHARPRLCGDNSLRSVSLACAAPSCPHDSATMTELYPSSHAKRNYHKYCQIQRFRLRLLLRLFYELSKVFTIGEAQMFVSIDKLI